MLTVNIIAVGKLKDSWLREGLAEYAKRLSAYCRFDVIELDEYRLPTEPSQAEVERGIEAEADAILQKADKSHIIALCIEGKAMSSGQLAQYLEQVAQTDSRVSFVIGGSHGLSLRVKQRSAARLSVSPMTFPHQLFRVMLAEQIYRAFSISSGSRYHK